ncbi:MAG: tyrosine-type recombinase/integrase [Bacteroidota bacterium]
MLKTFFNYLTHEKRYSQHTITSYKTDLLQFQDYIDTTYETSFDDINHQIVRSWMVELKKQGNSAKSINRKISTLRSFYKYLKREGLIEKDPLSRVKSMKPEKSLPQFVKESDMTALLDDYTFDPGFRGLRDRLILELLYGTGIRLNELINIRDFDINTSENTLKVLGKRNKERIIPLPVSLLYLIEDYKVARDQEIKSSDEILLVTDKGDQCYPMFIYRLVKKHLTHCTTLNKRSPHVLRHTFATHLLNKGADLNAVKDLLGHAGLAATQVYTHNSLDKIKTVFDQAHPKA